MSRNHSRIYRLFVGLLAVGLSIPALAQSVEFPTYEVGANKLAAQGPAYPSTDYPWVVSNGQIITPAGTTVYLGTTTRAKAIALNPNIATSGPAAGHHTAAVLQMQAPQSVTVFDTVTGAVVQKFSPLSDTDGSQKGIAYTPDGSHLLISQDGYETYTSYVTVINVSATTGELSGGTHVSVPIDVNADGYLTNVTCFPNSPGGTTGSFEIPCGYPYSIFSDDTYTSYPTDIAISSDSTTAYAVLDNNDTLAKISGLTGTPAKVAEVRVGNVPHSVIISPDGSTAYVSNEAGRIATADDFQEYSNGTPVVARYPEGSTATGTVSVVDLSTFTVTGSIETGLHPTGMAFWGKNLLVANAYSDSISVIDTTMNQVVRTIDLGLPIGVPGDPRPAYGAGPNSIAVDATKNIAYVALYNANAVAVVDLNNPYFPVLGMIPTGYAPSSVVLDTADNALLVANDKGIGTTGYATGFSESANPAIKSSNPNTAENSYGHEFGVYGFNTHQDLGIVSIIPVPSRSTLDAMTKQVYQNNHWDLAENILAASGGNPFTPPAAIPAHIGDPSKIKHVFVIIRENRTYDQILGDVAGGNGEPAMASFGDDLTYVYTSGAAGDSADNIGTQPAYAVTPNAHALVARFPLFDNFYDPSRQSADGHNWITQAMAPYSDDIQSPDWFRDYPSNGGDAIAYQKKGHLWDAAAKAGVKVKNYGEYIEYDTFNVPGGCTPNNQTQDDTYDGTVPSTTLPFVVSDSCEPSWTQFYNDVLKYDNHLESQLYYYNTVVSHTPLPNLYKVTVQNYPQFDLGIPDQFRFDIWNEDFQKDVAAGTVPQLEFMWISSDHTGGPPTAQAMQADNDLALGRFVDAISHSKIWDSSAIFVEEDDAQTGVDHVDGHRSPGYVISPYVKQNVNPDGSGAGNIDTGAGMTVDSIFYTQVNMTRTIEQILGITPMNQFDLVASPMREIFIDNPPAANFLAWTHVQNDVPLCQAVLNYLDPDGNPCAGSTLLANASPKVKALQAAWLKEKAMIFAGKYHIPDSEDPNIVKHYDWYEATGFVVPFPGEKTVRFPNEFKSKAPAASADLDD